MAGNSISPDICTLSPVSAEAKDDIIHLQEIDIAAGILTDIIEPDGQPIILACIDDMLVEAPKAMSRKLWPFIGRRICLAVVDGKFRAGALTET
jgi:hypothetical protein